MTLARLTGCIVAAAVAATLLTSTGGARTLAKHVKRPDLAVSAVANPIAVVEGDRTTFTVTVSNRGRRNARDVSLVGIDLNHESCPSSPLPCNGPAHGGFDFLSLAPTQGTCTLRPDTSSFVCSVGTIRAGGTAHVVVVAVPYSLHVVQGTSWIATVVSQTIERNYRNNAAMATVYVAVPTG